MSEKMREELIDTLNQYHVGSDEPPYVIPLLKMTEIKGTGFIESIMAWATRWAGRPSYREVELVLLTHRLIGTVIDPTPAIEAILDLYPARAPKRVTMEEIYNAVSKHCACPITVPSQITDDIYCLIGVKEEKPKWCECMDKMNQPKNPLAIPSIVAATENWEFCPICSAPRPA